MAAVLAYGPEAVLSHGSAAALWGILRRRAGSIHVTKAGRQRGRRGQELTLHGTTHLPERDRDVVDGIPLTSVPRTLLDLAGGDPGSLRRALEEADRLGLLQRRALVELGDRSAGHRGIREFRQALGAHIRPPDVDSELERLFLDLCLREGIPLPSSNVLVAGHEVDCLWSSARLVVELDGYAFHRTRAAHDRDHERDVDLALAGYAVRRFTFRQVVDQPGRVAAALRQALGAG